MPRWSNSFYDRGGGGRGRPGSRGGGGTREAFSNVFSAGCFSMAKQPDTYIDFKHRPAENPRQRAVSRFLQTGDEDVTENDDFYKEDGRKVINEAKTTKPFLYSLEDTLSPIQTTSINIHTGHSLEDRRIADLQCSL